MRWIVGLVIAVGLSTSGYAQQRSDPAAAPISVPPLPASAKPLPVALTRIGSQVRDGQEVGSYLSGAICVNSVPVVWSELKDGFANLSDLFGEELQTAGFKPDRQPGNLFADSSSAADLQVGAMIKSARVSYCENLVNVTGKLTLEVEWQVYSGLKREVVATIRTQQMAQWSRSAKERRSLQQLAFAQNVRALLSSEDFRKVVTSDVAPADPRLSAASLAAIAIKAPPGGPGTAREAVGSVVAILTGDGHGSGFLVSNDGYLITNQHVVGSTKFVKVRWSDGFESLGEVLRSDKRRDVALVKTEPRGRAPLAMRREAIQQGESVYAVGAPLDEKLQGTLTKGIVSATRVLDDGFSYIQSDVAISPGNSGGPLLDEKGAVIGITVSMQAVNGAQVGVNFFIPIGDAIDFLALKPAA